MATVTSTTRTGERPGQGTREQHDNSQQATTSTTALTPTQRRRQRRQLQRQSNALPPRPRTRRRPINLTRHNNGKTLKSSGTEYPGKMLTTQLESSSKTSIDYPSKPIHLFKKHKDEDITRTTNSANLSEKNKEDSIALQNMD